LPANTRAHQAEAITNVQEIPKTFDVYRVKGIVGKTFDIHPMKIRLIWETGEWDPVAGYGEDEEDSDDEDGGVPLNEAQRDGTITPNGRWMERKTEIDDSTRQIGFCVDGMEAKVRIELR
jgi:hypothetical protein